MCEYLLLNKDRVLLSFRLLRDALGQEVCSELSRYAALPPGFVSISDWVDRRNYAKHKEHLRRWLHEWKIDNVKGFLDITHALGLNDTLWVKQASSALTWPDVSLYSQEFSDIVAVTAFSKGLQGLRLSSTSPEFTSEGSFAKCWVRDGANVMLYKKGSEGFANSGLEPYSEFYASQLSRMLCKASVQYNLVMFKGSLVSSCKMFTSESEGFVPIYKYLDSSRHYNLIDILALMDSLGFGDDFRDMIILDAVILNPDRHFGNFGFIVDNDTFEVKAFAPVFDHNMALLAHAMNETFAQDTDYVRSLGHKAGGDFVLAAKHMLTRKNKKLLRGLLEFSFAPHTRYNLPPERLALLSATVHQQVRDIL